MTGSGTAVRPKARKSRPRKGTILGLHPAMVVAAVTFIALLGAAGFRAAPSVLMVPLQQEFGWSRTVLSVAVGVNLVLFGLTAPFAAALMDRFGIRRVVATALVLVAAGSGLTVFVTSQWQLVLCWGILVGLGTGSMALVFAATIASRWFVKGRGLVMGVLTAGSATGQLIFLPVLAAVTEKSGWRPASLIIAAAALAVVPLVLLFLRDRPADRGVSAFGAAGVLDQPEDLSAGVRSDPVAGDPVGGDRVGAGSVGGGSVGAGSVGGDPVGVGSVGADSVGVGSVGADSVGVGSGPDGSDPVLESTSSGGVGSARRAIQVLFMAAHHRTFWGLAVGFAICGATTNGLIGTHFIPAAHDHGLGETTAAGLLAVVGIFDIVGTIASGYLTDRVNPRVLLALYYGFRGVGLMMLPGLLSDQVHPSIIAFVVVYGLDWVATVPPTVALCRQAFGEDGNIVFGWVFASHQIGAALVSVAAGVIRDQTGAYTIAWFGAAGMCLVAALVSFQIRKLPVAGIPSAG